MTPAQRQVIWRINRLESSEDLSASIWGKSNATITANSIAAPNGDTTADTMTSTSGVATCGAQQIRVMRSGLFTFSAYAKAGTCSWLRLVVSVSGATTNRFAWFDVTNGALGTVQSGILSTAIVDSGGGWFRVSATWLAAPATDTVFFRMADADAGDLVTSGRTIYLWGAQLNFGPTARQYRKRA